MHPAVPPPASDAKESIFQHFWVYDAENLNQVLLPVDIIHQDNEKGYIALSYDKNH